MASNIAKLKSKTVVADSLTKKSKDGKEVRISVEEIENGYLVTQNIEWNDPKKGWQYKTKKIFSASNPLEFNMEDTTLADSFDK
jgi:hypothetical protein